MPRLLLAFSLFSIFHYLLSTPPAAAAPCSPTVPNILHPFTKDPHPPRPSPAEPCDPLIPINREPEISFACGKSLNTEGDIIVRPGETSRNLTFNITIDLSSTKIPVLGNTEDPNLNDATKINQYLSYYLNGTVQQADQIP